MGSTVVYMYATGRNLITPILWSISEFECGSAYPIPESVCFILLEAFICPIFPDVYVSSILPEV